MSIRQFVGIQEIAKKAFNSLIVIRKEIESKNQEVLAHGISVYNQVVPVDASKSKFGFFRSSRLDNRSDHRYYDMNPLPAPESKIARVYIMDDNRMHQTPTMRQGYHWNVQIERGPIHRMPWSGWTFSKDQKSREVYKFVSLEAALEFCQQDGYGYIVQYPHFRYTSKRKYADNFKWKGFPKDEQDS
ncbi:unnamed protein product [Paramecium octaurelia]|uniref:NADH dehydrogenase [ubiquinone] iron-sulfur protein 4, mitochondrial n=1 Tax=Paramecium octaurelia TaxID=43137 RepID=A0A8S1UB25_PAROT|nr:unnamed protein product [Paramecium octaurelia]